MKKHMGIWMRVLTIVCGVLVNASLSYLIFRYQIPMYFDTIGTIGVAALAGVFPGFLTAMLTNVFCGLFNPMSIYYSTINILIAAVTACFVSFHLFDKKRNVLWFILILSLLGGGLGGLLQIMLLGQPQYSEITLASEYIVTNMSLNYYLAFLLVNICLNIIDKGISVGIVLVILHLLPEKLKQRLWTSGWKQRPLTEEEIKRFRHKKYKTASLQHRVTRMLIFASLSMTIIMGFISMRLYFNNTKQEYTQSAQGAAKIAASIIDADMMDAYVKKGHDAPGYDETEKELYRIRDNSFGVQFLYAIVIDEEGCHMAFDCATEDVPANKPGTFVPFEEAFEPYVDDLLAGREIRPIESDDISGWVLTVYEPIKNAAGITTGYVGVDVSMSFLSDYVREYALKATLIFSGFLLLILSYGLWAARYYLIHPINSMAGITKGFMEDPDNQVVLQENVKILKALDIQTGDEIQNLYRSLCKMMESAVNKMSDIRHQGKRINQMQAGLIITMADMVESRDSDTGYHIQKTADYVKIILQGLQKKGYYKEKMTPKYMEDVQMSAPLHDIGKINIPDAVLNKPGKLTDEEYEIMKRHTTEGKKLMEKAISTVQGESYLKEARNMAAYHHEKWDGSGYPEGLKGPVIPLSARIMAVADVFDALTARRVYKEPMPFDKAMSIIEEGAGTHFDPKCVEVFLEAEQEVRRVQRKYQD
ncbi:MAG: HD domain-containing protein [Lachnospiraceae bacterium]|nr:HD domain-containing protein [Lachnospiraceae bacterium]